MCLRALLVAAAAAPAAAQGAPSLPLNYSVTVTQTAVGIGSGTKKVVMAGGILGKPEHSGVAWRDGSEINEYGMLGTVWKETNCVKGEIYTYKSASECVVSKARADFDCPCPGAIDQYGEGPACQDQDISLGYLSLAQPTGTGPCTTPSTAGQTCTVYGFTLGLPTFGYTTYSVVFTTANVPVGAALTYTYDGVPLSVTTVFTDYTTDYRCFPYDLHEPSGCSGKKPPPDPAPCTAPLPPLPPTCDPAPACDACCTGVCRSCQACVNDKSGDCAACWKEDPQAKTSCLYKDGHGCQKCWPPVWNPAPAPPGPPAPGPGPAPAGCDAAAACDACCTGACLPCRGCVGVKTGQCAACYAVDPTVGTACLYDDGHGCQKCWSPSGPPPPAPPAPSPPAPSPPSPSPSPGSCAPAGASCEDDHHACCSGLHCESGGGKHTCSKDALKRIDFAAVHAGALREFRAEYARALARRNRAA